MSACLEVVNHNQSATQLCLKKLQSYRREMAEALIQGDWNSVLRLDRLTGQVIESASCHQENQKRALVDEMVAIKKIYVKALLHINFSIAKVPSQAI